MPRVLHHGQWRGHEVLVMSALPVWRRRTALRPGQLTAAMAEVAAVGGRGRGRLAASAFLARITSRLGTHARRCRPGQPWPPRSAPWPRPTRSWASGPGTGTGPAGTWRRTRHGLLVWDWERFTRPVPARLRPLHYRLQTAVVRRRQPPPAAAADVRHAPRRRRWPRSACRPAEARLTALLYLAELSVRYLADRQAEAGARLGRPGTWLIPAIDEAMRTL